MNRKLLWAVLVIGVALVIAPLAMGLPSKASAGERMLNGFQPIMQPAQVQITADYYNHVFVPLGTVTPMMSAQNLAKFQKYMPLFATMPKQAQSDFAGLFGTMKANVGIFSRVPAGLRHYKPLVMTMQANVDNYKQVNSLPSFRLFPWFFIVPGILLILISSYGLFDGPTRTWIAAHRPHPTPA